MMEDDGLIADSRELWDAIVDRAGLDENGYDAELVAELASALNIPATDFRNDLARHNVSVERLLLTFLTLIGPYAAMVRELLSFFARAGARATADNLRIEFDFNQGSTSFDFDLKNFRDWERRWRESMARLIVDRLDPVRAGQLRYAFVRHGVTYTIVDGTWSDISPRDPTIAQWLRESATDPQLLRALPSVPDVADPDLAAFLARVWTLLFAVSEPTLWEADPPLAPDDVRAIVRGAYLLQVEAGSLLPRLMEVFSGVEQQTVDVTVVLEQLFEVFNLPIWSRRSELYSVWVGARLIGVFAAKARVHTTNRTLTFSFRGTHLATVRLPDDSNFAVWCEVRTPASGLVGKGRVKAIQPDFLVMAEPTSHADSTVLVVECKQYRHQSSQNFAAALVDYARNHRNAKVILVNYGPVTGAVISRVKATDPLVLPRTLPIGTFRPGSVRAIGEFEAIVRAVIPASTESADVTQPVTIPPGTVPSASAGAVRVFWDGGADFDLHCWVVALDGSVEHVDYNRNEWSGSSGRVWLEADIRTGGTSEALFWEGVRDARLELAVHAFTTGSSIRSTRNSRADLIVGGITITLEPTGDSQGTWWHLVTCGPQTGGVHVWNVVQETPPISM